MKISQIYQTVANYGNAEELETAGPILCTNNPWLGNGYYFWDGLIFNARWWGKTHYRNNYLIFSSSYDAHSDYLFNLVGNPEHIQFFRKFSYQLMKKLNCKTLKVATVIEFLKRERMFPFLAIRAEGRSKTSPKMTPLYFDDQGLYYLQPVPKIQICIVDYAKFHYSEYKFIESSN